MDELGSGNARLASWSVLLYRTSADLHDSFFFFFFLEQNIIIFIQTEREYCMYCRSASQDAQCI